MNSSSSFYNDFKDENENFKNVYLYNDMLEISRKFIFRNDLNKFRSERVSKRDFFEKPRFNSHW